MERCVALIAMHVNQRALDRQTGGNVLYCYYREIPDAEHLEKGGAHHERDERNRRRNEGESQEKRDGC